MKKILISTLILIIAVAASIVFQPGKTPVDPKPSPSGSNTAANNTVQPDDKQNTVQPDDRQNTVPAPDNTANNTTPSVPDVPDGKENTLEPSKPDRTVEGVILGEGVEMGNAPDGYFRESLFIGDSRMFGLQSYGDIKEGYWYAATSMGAFNINNKAIDVSGIGAVVLDDLLKQKQFPQIYINMGINEIGYEMGYLQNAYKEFYDKIRAAQPNAKIIIISNLHVTKAHSDTGTYGVTNSNINTFNEYLKSLQDGKNIFYLDVNHLFDDAGGALDPAYTGDGVHVYAQQYLDISAYLRSHAIYDKN